ncbi:very short patch repair endonuclease [Cellulomonas endophytica]|uniref:very short patch repair endonuclease n=1 Tax=Cellulomonas endophytica TaxID=2494735 RepID=UPI0010122F4C|nr:very short patch repair endonuclease [Cellulomonas endophytica]
MSTLARRDNPRELALRRALHAQGFRYRVTVRVPGLPRRTIDVAFPRARVAVFVDGCFWHGCSEHSHAPRSNSSWWAQKLAANRARDADTTRHLQELGWTVLRIWEHVPLDDAVATVVAAVAAAREKQAGTGRRRARDTKVLDGSG